MICRLWGHQPEVCFEPGYTGRLLASCARCHGTWGPISVAERFPSELTGAPRFRRVVERVWCHLAGHQDELDPLYLLYRCRCEGNVGFPMWKGR